MNFSIQSRKIGFLNVEASVGGHSSYILLFKNNDNCVSKSEHGPKPGENMLGYTGRIGCSALTDLVLKCFSDTSVPRFWITPLHFILTYHMKYQWSFIIARAFYAHVLGPRPNKKCMKIYANSRYKDKSAQTVVCQSKHSSKFDFQEATLLCQPYSDCACTQTSL